MKTQISALACLSLACLSLACLGGCQARSTADVAATAAQLQSEQAKNVELTRRADQAAAAEAATQEKSALTSKQLDAAKKQLSDEHHNLETLKSQLTEALSAKSAAEDQSRKALADNDVLRGKLSHRGTFQTIDDTPPLDATVPEEIRNAFRNSLAWRANQVRSLEIRIQDTPSRAEAKLLGARLEKLKASPVTPPSLAPSNLTLGQIGPLQVDDFLRVDQVVDDNTLVVTPIKIDPSLTPQNTGLGSTSLASPGMAFVREESNPIALHGFPTKGAVTGAKITALPGLYFVEKTQRYGARTIFVLAPVDAIKLRAYFDRLQIEFRAAAKSKSSESSGAAAK